MAAKKDIIIDVEEFLHEFSFEKEMDDDPVAVIPAGFAGPAGPATSIAVGVVANSIVTGRVSNAAAAASVAKSVTTGIIANAVAVDSVPKSVTAARITNAAAAASVAKSVAAVPVVKSATAPVVKSTSDPIADVTVEPVATNSAIDNKRAHRPRGTAAGIRRQQDRFMRFLYQLSSAHYNWGKRPRRVWQN